MADDKEARAGLSRRTFFKGAAATVVGASTLAVGLGLSGCGGAGQKEASGSQDGKSAAPQEFTDGTYIASAISMHGPIQVETVIADGKIEAVTVLNHKETYLIGETAVKLMPTRIVESQCLDVDAVTGATITSMAIQSAVSSAIANAGGDKKDFSGYSAPAVTATNVDKSADVVIVGAGMAGLMAAKEAAGQGKSVIVFEKMPYLGGCMPMTSTAWNAQETNLQKTWGVDLLPNKSVASTEAWLKVYADFVLDPTSKYYNPEMPFIRPMFEGVRESTDFLQSIGVGFCPIGDTSTPTLAPGQFSIGGKYCVETVVGYLRNHYGVEFITEAPVKQLTVENGAVVGLIAEGSDGATYHVASKAVLLATGSFIKNDELMKEYNPDDLKFTIMGPPWATGDGMLMAKDAGAAWGTMDQGVTSHYTAAKSLAEVSFIHYVCPGVIVNSKGERFVSEALEYKQALRLFKEQENTDFYWVFDEASRQGMLPSGNSYRLDYTFLLETGDVVEAADYEELAAETGLSELVATLDTVNDCAINGTEDAFGNEKLAPIATSGNMYALKVIPAPYIAQGGVNIDPAGHVLREDGSSISGLYAAGDVTGSVENRDGAMYRVGLTQALGYGTVVGKTIVAEL